MNPENIMFCPRCGCDNPGKAKFCNECGFDLHEVRSLLLKQKDSDETPDRENVGAPIPADRSSVPVKKEDPRKPYVRTTTLLPDSPDENPRQYPAPVQPFSAQQPLPSFSRQVPESPLMKMSERIRNPSLAAALSLIPGLGQVYNGMLIRGIVLFIATFLGLFIFIIPGICIWIYCIYDAYKTSGKINSGEIPFDLKKKLSIFFLH
jgi:hypothetical protein